MHRIFIAFAALSCVVSFLHPRDVRAGTAVRMDVAGLVDRAELVVEARVIGSRPLLTAGGRRIETEYTLDVKRTFLGETLSAQSFRLPGGVLPASQGGRGLVIAGMPSLVEGEDVVLFLTVPSSKGLRMPVGLAQGKYRIVRDAEGRQIATQSLDSLSLVDAHGARAAAAPGALELDALVREIEAAVAARREREARQAAGSGR
jgi:hypothetical protein